MMAVKNCCIESCDSSTNRKEDVGVTFHKFPKHIPNINILWLNITKQIGKELKVPSYICSRHFCKSDFVNYQGSKYILKSDAVPSIFPWNINEQIGTKDNKMDPTIMVDNNEDVEISKETNEYKEVVPAEFKEEIADLQNAETVKEVETDNILKIDSEPKEENEFIEPMDIEQESTMNLSVPASSFMDIILTDKRKGIAKKSLSPSAKDLGNASMALSVGSKVEAKDYEELWYPAHIIEVDYDEMEVLVHYDNHSKRHDEWINVSSPRLRPYTSSANHEKQFIENSELSGESKGPLKFEVGERCLARWKDNSRFTATIHKDLGNGKYEIVFDDGVPWTCNISRLFKLRQDSVGLSASPLHVDVPSLSPNNNSYPSSSSPSPHCPSQTPLNSKLPYHTHLFDPTRDYLGSKVERRELKRKLNIKALFNIGQSKRRRKNSDNKKDTPRIVNVDRKPRKKRRGGFRGIQKLACTNTDPQVIIHDIQNTILKDIAFKVQNITGEKKSKMEIAVEDITAEEIRKSLELEEGKLENFEQVNEKSHAEVIGKIRKAINKLEVGLETLSKVNENTVQIAIDVKQETEVKVKEEIKEDSKEEIKEDTKEEIKEDKVEIKEDKVEIKEDTKEEIKEKINIENVTEPLNDKEEIKLNKESALNVKGNSINPDVNKRKVNKKLKKLRLIRENKVKKEVEKAKSELQELKRELEEIKKQVRLTTKEALLKSNETDSSAIEKKKLVENELLPGEWCCKWVNGQPQGIVTEIEGEPKFDANNKLILPRCTVQVEDKRIPPLWTKHMVRRSLGNSAGKWDVMLVSPDNRKIHTKSDMKLYLENVQDDSLKPYERALLDFGIHRKLSRRMGWDDQAHSEVYKSGPILKIKRLNLKKDYAVVRDVPSKKRRKLSSIKSSDTKQNVSTVESSFMPSTEQSTNVESPAFDSAALEDGYVYVGSLKVQILENLLRCPAEGCYKNFRNNTLLKMHIKHYHRELRKMMGATPKVLDLAYARAAPAENDNVKLKQEHEPKMPKPKMYKQKRIDVEPIDVNDLQSNMLPLTATSPGQTENDSKTRLQDSPKLRKALIGNKPVKRPRVLLPVRRLEDAINQQVTPVIDVNKEHTEDNFDEESNFKEEFERKYCSSQSSEPFVQLDFESEISAHTVPKTGDDKKKKKANLETAQTAKLLTASEDDWVSDMETISSFPMSGSPDSKNFGDIINHTSIPESERQSENQYITTENGEKIKIVHMKREEIINCHCGFREEDGLMIQCELCLCWQHALCHNIQKEAEVPEKYTCSICLNPRRGRRSQRFMHDQDSLYEGVLPGAATSEPLRRSHELSGNLIRLADALHALKIKYYVATKKDHPKLYLWAQDWESGDLNDKLATDYVDLSAMISDIGKENLPLKPDDLKDICLSDLRTLPLDDSDELRLSQKSDSSNVGQQALLSNLMSSPTSVGSLDLQISTSELEKLAKSVQEAELPLLRNAGPIIPQPEAAIENSVCRERLLKHIQRCQALIDARLDSIEAQVAELESQDPSFEDDETADFFPRTKQTIQMLLRDLDTMEELGVIT